MAPIWKKKPGSGQNNSPEFEIVLENTLRPVEPNPEFREKLHSRLITAQEINYDPGGISRSQLTLILVIVLMTSLFISVMVAVGRLISKFWRC